MKCYKGQPSWQIRTKTVEAYVTQMGGHLAPAIFKLGNKSIEPFAIAPWALEKLPADADRVLRPMRGDFFCMPFGGNAQEWRDQSFVPHGPTASEEWTLQTLSQTPERAVLKLMQKYPYGGRIEKHVELRANHSVIYQRHTITGICGSIPLGHHPIIQFPDEPECGYVATSRFVYGQVFPQQFENPEKRGYSALKPGALFTSLAKVPTIFGNTADLSRYPARRGYEDIVLLASDRTLPFAWSAAAFPKQGYVYFSLKNPRQLASTLFWISNGGRHYAPWNGRHVNVMGMEEVTAYFHLGLKESASGNALKKRGIPTTVKLSTRHSYQVDFIMGVARIAKSFRHIAQIVKHRDGIKIISTSGDETFAQMDLNWIV